MGAEADISFAKNPGFEGGKSSITPRNIYDGGACVQLNLLGISGSPRKGNSEYLLEKAMKAAEKVAQEQIESTFYSIRGKKIGPCIACSRCIEKLEGECSIKDDFQELRDLWLSADIILYSVPVYHMSIPGQLKCFVDRLGNSNFGRYMQLFPPGEEKLPKLLKVIGSITQGIHIHSGQEHTLTDLINHALIMQCIPVTGDMWEAYIGCGGWTSNAGERDALQQQYNENKYDAVIAVKAAESVGKRAAETALIVYDGVEKNRSKLGQDPAYKPLLDHRG